MIPLMSVRPSLLAVPLLATAAFAACRTIVGVQSSTSGAGGHSAVTTGSGGNPAVTTGAGGNPAVTTGGGGTSVSPQGDGGGDAPVNCATCTASERCIVFQPCLEPPEPYACVACQERPYCGSDGKVYDTECAALAAGEKGGVTCTAPPGRYRCGSYYCDATSEDCGSFNPAGRGEAFVEPACVPCSPVSQRTCGDDGQVYESACALLQAGHQRGLMCPGFVECGGSLCDTATEMCVMGNIPDCQGGTPTQICVLAFDAGG
jgi:hypothetical protein